MNIAAELQEAAEAFFTRPYSMAILGGSSGFSGSSFARVADSRGHVWCLRRWPDGYDEQQLRFIHQALRHSRAYGFWGVPALAHTRRGDTALRYNDSLFDAQAWIAGKPPGALPAWDGPVPNRACALTPTQLDSLAAALAAFHRSVARLQPYAEAQCLPLAQRLTELHAESRTRQQHLAACIERHAQAGTDATLAARWLKLMPEALALATEVLQAYPAGAFSTATLCHGDLWAPHVLFDGNNLSGLVDFESLCFSSAAAELAQAILHFGGWQIRDSFVRTYEQHTTLRVEDKAVLPAAAVLDLVREGYWSLDQLFGAANEPAQREAHLANLRVLLASLEQIRVV